MDSRIKENFGIYVHFPFCKRKCYYCDFYSVGERLADWDGFGAALEREYAAKAVPSDAIVSLYLGGGTPSLAPTELIVRLRKMISNEVGEFTIEVNPDDVTDEKARAWRDAGVNRVSMGVQSLRDEELKSIGRRHDSLTAHNAYKILRKYFTNISLDLIFGLPGQSVESLSTTLDAFIAMQPEHISAYSLMYEERTALTRMRDSGQIAEAGEEDSVEMFRTISRRLREAGYERYEISNYSLPDCRSHHNSNYWKGVPYVGLGPSAHSYDGKFTRCHNAPDLSLYIKEWGGEKVITSVATELLTCDELREEMILTRLRMSEGLDLTEYRSRFGETEYKKILRRADTFLKSGSLYYPAPSMLALTEEGVMISDEVIVGLF